MLGWSGLEWMRFWRNASKESRQNMKKKLHKCMRKIEDSQCEAREDKMSLCEWLEEPMGFRFEACREPNEFGELIEECE